MSAATKRKEPFAHAADLPAAYREYAEVIKELSHPSYTLLWDLEQLRHRDVRTISTGVVIDKMNQLMAHAARLRAAAIRVENAIRGNSLVRTAKGVRVRVGAV